MEDVAPPEPIASEPEESDVPDARTQVAIEVETLTPQAAPVALDTTRRTYEVRPGDSLWNIARQFRPAGAGENLYQMLLSIHNLNRNAFINGNISLLKTNTTLQIPTVDDINRIDPLTAQAEFDRRWNEGTQRFTAVQRGEPIPLFTSEPVQEEVVEVEDELPPGEEAPISDDDDTALLMVSQTNVPQPLQIAGDAEADVQPADIAVTDPALPVTVTVQTESVTVVDEQQAVPDAVPLAPGPGSVSGTITRAVVTAELETEVAAMRVRRQSAETIAAQLNASLQRVQEQRVAQASLFGTENLLLAASALGLFAALMAAVVFSLRIAGDLRLRNSMANDGALDAQAEPAWLTTDPGDQRVVSERREPHMPEMEVVEIQLPDGSEPLSVQTGADGSSTSTTSTTSATSASVSKKPAADDLFARMDDLLGGDNGNSGKNS